MTTITIPEVTLILNSSSIGSVPSLYIGSGSITMLYVNGTFQTPSGSFVGSYNYNFPLTSSSDLSSSIANIDTLVETKVKALLGL